VLLVLHLEGMAFVVYKLDLDAAVGAVLLGVAGVVDDLVLAANGFIDDTEVVRGFGDEARLKAHAAGHVGKGAHLVVGLQIVHIAELLVEAAAAFSHGADESTGGDGEDGDIGGFADLVEHLVEGELGEGVAAGGDDDDVLLAVNTADAVKAFVKSVEEVALAEAGDAELVNVLHELAFVLGEVGDDLGAQVEGHQSDVVLRTKLRDEAEGGVAHVIDVVVIGSGELADHKRCDGSFHALEADDLLLLAVFVDAEVGRLEAGNELVGLFEENAYVDGDLWDFDVEGDGRHPLGSFDFGCGGCYGRWDIVVGGRLLLGNGDRALIIGWAAGVGLLLVRLWSWLLRGLGGLLGFEGGRRGSAEDKGEGQEECLRGDVRDTRVAGHGDLMDKHTARKRGCAGRGGGILGGDELEEAA